MLRTEVWAVLVATIALAAPSAKAQDAVPIITPTMPNYVGFGLGVTTDYIGADDYFFGGLPLARYQFKDSQRYASLVGTFVDFNLINHPIIRFGPTAQLRFGRSDVSNRAVRQLPSISKTIELACSAGLSSSPRTTRGSASGGTCASNRIWRASMTAGSPARVCRAGIQSSGWPSSASRSAPPMAAAITCRPSSA
jgi:hypothetical protein